MRKLIMMCVVLTVAMACSNRSSNSKNESDMDTTPVLSPTNNELRSGTDTLGIKSDTVSIDSLSGDSM